jgi:small subunit ribosomal protein S2
MIDVPLKDLLTAGCHFGHQVTRWHPKAAKFIYTVRDGIHIIDLAQTRTRLLSACEYISTTVANGGTVIFVGTKRQAQGVVKEAAEKVGAPYITTHWPGGLLTNWEVMYKNLLKIKTLNENINNEEIRKTYTKKEVLDWTKELSKLMRLYGGISELTKQPDAVFIVDTHKEKGAVAEATKMNVTVLGITDTNANPDYVDYPIPANDDAVGSIKLIVDTLAAAFAEGKGAQKKLEDKKIEAETKKETSSVKKINEKKPVEKEVKTEEKVEEKPKVKKSVPAKKVKKKETK